MNKIFVIIAVAILIGAGLILGYRKGLEAPRPSILENSKVVLARYAAAQGIITAIQDRTVTLTSQEGDTLSIPLAPTAKLLALILPQGKTSEVLKQETKEIIFSDVKVGDKVAVQLELGQNGAFEGISLTILP